MAFFGNNLALSAADVTGCCGLHLPQDGVHNPGGVAGALACGTGSYITVRSSPAAMAGIAGDIFVHLNPLLGAMGKF